MEKEFSKSFIVTTLKGMITSLMYDTRTGHTLVRDHQWGANEIEVLCTICDNYPESENLFTTILHDIATGFGFQSQSLRDLNDWIASLPDDSSNVPQESNVNCPAFPSLTDDLVVGTDSWGTDEGVDDDLAERTVESARSGDGGITDPYDEGRELRRALANAGRA